ncbi:hypothetical protein ABH892_000805 [Paenibacillus sp. RC254]|uniref:hypothetical protein n=2 Tax=unclassified Paenibacillus TaxID=185978 RepID=UPI0024B91B41|nr:hypothetical protein [Paenibacillus sp. RC334]
MERMKLQKDWLDYVNRLQERERQKIISSGITNWTLLLAVLGLAYWIYPDIIAMQKNWHTVLIGYVVFGNIATTFFDFFNNFYRQVKIKRYSSPITSTDVKGLKILWRYQLILVTSFLLSNGYFLFFHSVNFFFSLYFTIYCVRYLLEAVQASIYIFLENKKRKFDRKAIKMEIEQNSSKMEAYKFLKQLLIFLMWLLFSNSYKVILTFLLTIYICINYNFNNILWKQIFDGLASVIIVILLQFLFTIFMKRMKIGWLENLEREIVINNLTEDQIVSKLKLGYFNASNIDNYF